MSQRVNVGIIGCGNISGTYLRNSRSFELLNVTAVADLDMARARSRAAEFGVPRACGVDELLADPAIDIVVNLTIPAVHAEVSLKILEAGKSVYSEKPLATCREEGLALLEEAASRGVRIGCAPDTFLGGGQQTCRKLIDDGEIGRPVAATAFRANHGMEHWHENPSFFYQAGAGPLFDIGPYYLTALVNLLGPIRRVAGAVTASSNERPITGGPLKGGTIRVETPTHVTSILEFDSGAVGTTINSFDVWASELPRLEIYGTEGTLSVPDPNTFGGPVRIRRAGDEEWREVPLTHGHGKESRGLGLADMALGMLEGTPHRASGELAFHVLDIMQSILEAAERARYVDLGSTTERPTPLPLPTASE
ncbi:MAG: Gfo/Idh/MocA family oxidoreductase [Trueperaceae bacterium]